MIALHSIAARRPGIFMTETVVALALLASAAALAAPLVSWAIAERSRADARLEAVDAAANVFEQASARKWDDLTPEWASSQRFPDHLTARWPEARLTARVDPEANRPRVKRVTVEVKWTGARETWPALKLTSLYAARAPEGKP